MGDTNFRGPLASMGSMEIQSGNTATIEPFDGPSLWYQGQGFPDPRFAPFKKDAPAPGRQVAYYDGSNVTVVDAIPSANTTAGVAATQAPSTTAGAALTLATAVLGTAANVPVWSPGIPIMPFGTTTVVTVSAIDFGFTTGTTAANSSTVVTPDNTQFKPGQWIVIAGAGSAGATNVALITQVVSVTTGNTTAITISPVAATALNNAPIGQGNLYNQFLPPGTQFGPATASANAAEPYIVAGLARMFDPRQGVCRALCVQAASIGSGTTAFTVSGYDVYGVPMTELITCSGTTIVNGQKAFKYVSSIVVTTAATTVTPANVQVGLSDIFGLNLRSDSWGYLGITWNNCAAPTSAGWTAALTTTSNASTIDVRGTVNASTLAVATVASTNGGRRLTIIQTLPLNTMLNATPLATTALFGATQA